MFYLRAFTREPVKNYSVSVAGSVHFEYRFDEGEYQPLNQNYGMLFPTSEVAEDNTIVPCYVKNIRCFVSGNADSGTRMYAIVGEYVTFTEASDISGAVNVSRVNNNSERLYWWTTSDFCEFDEKGFVTEAELTGWQQVADNVFIIDEKISSEKMSGAIIDKWVPLSATAVCIKSGDDCSAAFNSMSQLGGGTGLDILNTKELDEIKAVIKYSDGSTDAKRIDWMINPSEVNSEGQFTSGIHEIHGRIHKDNLPFPLTKGYADPVLFKWEGMWYFLSTNDNTDDVGMYVRRADTVENLFNGNAVENCILPYTPEKGFVQTFWAPEFHIIGEELYILFAVGGHQWSPQCHMMRLKKGGDILKAEDWEEPVRVLKADGSYLGEGGITLDMTHFRIKNGSGGRDYLAWSFRQGIGTPLDTGSMIYIATTDADKPWVLTSEPMLLTRPLYGWENTEGTINNEGPYALITDDKVYLAYSGGSANGYTYVVGMMIANIDADLLDLTSWKKTPCPMLSSYSVGIDGPGHNSFYVSDEGKTMIAYHGQLGPRCSAIHRVHFNKNGFPLLNMAPDRDVPDNMRDVTIRFNVSV